ncbi:MAG: hypothetical protein ACR2QX_15335 [Woeseiaceae bacterium]
MNRKIGGIIFSIIVGLAVATMSYRWITDPQSREIRLLEEQVVTRSRGILAETIASGPLEIVDPLAPDRKVGKVYIYPATDGWEISGYYRRGATDLWHPFLMQLDETLALVHLKISDQDAVLVERGSKDPLLEVMP